MGTRRGMALALLSVSSLAGPAAANGRLPGSLAISVRTALDADVVAGVTFGALVSHDGGQSWSWICEQALGIVGPFDPKLRWTADGTLLGTSPNGLARSTDGGCTWQPALGTERLLVTGLDLTADERAAVVSTFHGETARILRSTDGGARFEEVLFERDDVVVRDVRHRPSSDEQLVAILESFIDRTAWLLVSADAGGSWEEWTLPAGLPAQVKLLAVTSDAVLVSVSDRPEVYRTLDGGRTFETLVTLPGEVLAGHASSDGVQLWLSDRVGGTSASTDGGQTFSSIPAGPHALCFAGDADRLLSCASRGLDGWVLAESVERAAFTPVMGWFDEIEGPLACGPESVVTRECAPLWPALRDQFARSGPGPDAGAGVDSAVPEAGAPFGRASPFGVRGGGCACGVVAAPGTATPALLLAALAGLLDGRSRRR